MRQQYTVFLSANETRRLPVMGDYVRVLKNTGSESVEIGYDGSSTSPMESGLGHSYKEVFNTLYLKNPNAQQIEVLISVSFGPVDDARLTLTSSEGGIPVTLSAASVEIPSTNKKTGSIQHDFIPARQGRKRLVIQNLSTSKKLYFVGSSAVASGTAPYGVEVDPRGSLEVELETAIHFYEDSSGTNNAEFTYWEEF
jgi:hypothetical protein